jgi:xanthine phosphoribosyltransferase
MTARQTLINYIHRYGSINGDIIKVDTFLNHMVDSHLLKLISNDIVDNFSDKEFDKILTVESSGLVIAAYVSFITDKPFIFAKKKKPITMAEFYVAESYSFTKKEENTIYVSKEVLKKDVKILFVDDFYAHGSTYKAVCEIIDNALAELVGSAVIVNKSDNTDIYSIIDKTILKTL